MHASKNQKLYTETVHARVSSVDYNAIVDQAAAANISTGEWLRRLIARELRGDQNTRLVLAEIMDLRSILLTLQTEDWRDVEFTDDTLRDMVAKSGARKFAAADRIIVEAKQA